MAKPKFVNIDLLADQPAKAEPLKEKRAKQKEQLRGGPVLLMADLRKTSSSFKTKMHLSAYGPYGSNLTLTACGAKREGNEVVLVEHVSCPECVAIAKNAWDGMVARFPQRP